ncbi:MAG: hypothetical protein FWD61_07335 [Phycisphaerales bacterium]|nr:hypothetical protein [Phycisphaerales bacterium]
MKRLISFAALALVAGFAFAEEATTTATNVFLNDFTTGMGKWTLNKCEGKQDTEGLKITKTEQFGGIGLETNNSNKADLSAYKTIDFVMVNGGEKPIDFSFKIKSGQTTKATGRTDDKAATLAPGEHTVSFTIAGGDIDPKEINYIRIWTVEAGEVKLTIKKTSFTAK